MDNSLTFIGRHKMARVGIVPVCAAILMLAAPAQPAENPPIIPIGLDVYTMWDRLPYQRIGERAYMRSTYDRKGGNESADASHFLYYENVPFRAFTLDVEGPGVFYFKRTNHWHGSPWHYEVDNIDHIVQEPTTPKPQHPSPSAVFLDKLFPNPLVWTHVITKGADLMWRPIPFEKRFRMGYSRTRYGTGYYIYRQFSAGAELTRPIEAWDWKTPPDPKVLDLLNKSGSDLIPDPGTPGGDAMGLRQETGNVTVPRNGAVTLTELTQAPSMIRSLEITVDESSAGALDSVNIRLTWDGRRHPSIDAPVPLFYGAGTMKDRSDREHHVKGFISHIRIADNKAHLACFWPMPFFKSAKIELVGKGGGEIKGVSWRVRYAPYTDPPNHVGYFHATYKDHPEAAPQGKDVILLKTSETEGGGEWSGLFVGTSFIFSHEGNLTTLEGDPRFFFDDAKTPQAYGTGTEEWGGGGDYWGGREMTLPFAGHPCGINGPIESAYRFLIGDYMPFGRSAEIHLEHGGRNDSREHYKTVTYWYGAPSAALIPTDSLDIGNSASEKAHGYSSPDASEPYTFTSHWDAWGPDSPEEKATGRTTTGTSEFTIALEPDNWGVLLRRELDYQHPNQRAVVFIADNSNGQPAQWDSAGIWYLAGSYKCIYSDPKGELDPPLYTVQTSGRRLRDDEFLAPRGLTRGRTSIRIRVRYEPKARPLYPGYEYPEEYLWSELKYKAYCFVSPNAFDAYTSSKRARYAEKQKPIDFSSRTSSDGLYLHFPDANIAHAIAVFNARGEQVFTGKTGGKRSMCISTQGFIPGLHIVRVSGSGYSASKKVLISR